MEMCKKLLAILFQNVYIIFWFNGSKSISLSLIRQIKCSMRSGTLIDKIMPSDGCRYFYTNGNGICTNFFYQ